MMFVCCVLVFLGRLESEGSAGTKLVPQRPIVVLNGLLNMAAGSIVRLV